jgi:hypothetical protein
MDTKFPLDFTLDSGTHVVVQQTGADRYEFTLTPTDDPARHFTYVEGERNKAEWDEIADFEQLEALRRFWLETEDIV